MRRGPSAVAPAHAPLDKVEAEGRLLAILENLVGHAEVDALRQIFMAIPTSERGALWSRLRARRRDDRLAAAFHYRLATVTRAELLRLLDGETTPSLRARDPVELDALLSEIDDVKLALSPGAPEVSGDDLTAAVVAELGALDVVEHHAISLAWRVAIDARDYAAGVVEAPVRGRWHPSFRIDAPSGRSSLHVELVVDGTVRKVLRRLVEVGPEALHGLARLPPAVHDTVMEVLSRNLLDKRGAIDEAVLDDMLGDLASIAPGSRAAVVEALSAPARGASLSARFLALPSTVRPRLIAALARGWVAPASAVTLEHPLELEATPSQLVIAPWTKAGVPVRVTPRSPFGAIAGPALEVSWTVDHDLGIRIGEYRTAWRRGAQGEPLEIALEGSGVHEITASFAREGIVVEQIAVKVPVVVERESERAAADQMEPEQALAERATIREQLVADRTLALWHSPALWVRAAALDARLAATGRSEQPPPVADGERFEPPGWLEHRGRSNPPLSTNRARIRFEIEQRYKSGGNDAPPISFALRAYIDDGATPEAERVRAQKILGLVFLEEAALGEEQRALQRLIGAKGLELCRQLLDQGERDVHARKREYGFDDAVSPETPDNIEELAGAASDLVPLQEEVDAHEARLASVDASLASLQASLLRRDLDEATALSLSEAIDLANANRTDAAARLEVAEKGLYVRRGDLVPRFPILAVADLGKPDKYRFDVALLRELAMGELANVAAKLERVLEDIATVRGEIDEHTVWKVPVLLALTRHALGIVPGTFQDHAIERKLFLDRATRTINAFSRIGAAVLATIITFGAAGPMVWITSGGFAAHGFYELGKSIREYQFEKALTGTSYDKASALAHDEPSAFWLAFEIVTTAVGVLDLAAAAKGMNEARMAFGAIRSAHRAAAQVTDASRITRSLDELERVASTRGLSAPAQQRLRREALEAMGKRVDEVGSAARAMLKGSEELVAKATELHRAVEGWVAKLAGGTPVPTWRLEVLSGAEFEMRFSSKSGVAVFVLEDGKPVIYARLQAQAKDLLDEAAHVVQLGDPKFAPKLKYLDEVNLADWKMMSVADRLGFFQRKLEVEIDAKKRALALITDAEERAATQANLADLEGLARQVAGITDDQLTQLNAKVLAEPAFLDQPSRAFQKRKVPVAGSRPPRPQVGDLDPAAAPPREVSRTRGDADYSTAYNDKDVASVLQRGEVWREHVIVTSGYGGKITSVSPGKRGSTIVSVKDEVSGKLQRYVIEAGAELEPGIRKGLKIEKDARIAREAPREYRWVEVRHADGTAATRAEIRALDGAGGGKRAGWLQRGMESGERGRAAEAEAMAEADRAIAEAQAAGAQLYAKHMPHNVGGGGFDDVIVEFTTGADGLTARIRIREVKDYPNRYVPRSEFTALDDNWEQNLKKLYRNVQEALVGKAPTGYEGFTRDELAAIWNRLEADQFEVEIRLGRTTHLGEGHTAMTVPALSRRVGRNIDVKRIGEGDR
ncbi:MAG: hypothetical protein KIT31_17300 [Deltaproteobacteria bacterium]|nr:hypothetical protein [Deltaproteobacteria bacterium]